MTSPQELIDQAAEEYSNVNSNYRTKLEIKTDFKAGVTWRDEHIKELVEATQRLLDRIDANGGIGEYKGGPAFVVEPLRKALSAFKTKEKL